MITLLGPLLQFVVIIGKLKFTASIKTFPNPSYREFKMNNFELR